MKDDVAEANNPLIKVADFWRGEEGQQLNETIGLAPQPLNTDRANTQDLQPTESIE